jgi:protein SMG5
MKDMAQLRLQAEVSQLEGRLQEKQELGASDSGGAGVPLPPYLIPDALTICNHLPQVKQLTNSGRFILIIPIAGTKY